jgi:hypothetical protein
MTVLNLAAIGSGILCFKESKRERDPIAILNEIEMFSKPFSWQQRSFEGEICPELKLDCDLM